MLALAVALANFSACTTARLPVDQSLTSKDRGVTSRYLIGGKGKDFYHYGNFCGPGQPYAEGNPANLSAAAAIQPVDSIDRACKLHDMCYMKFGADNYNCDRTATIALNRSFDNQPMPLARQCYELTVEIMSAVIYKGQKSFDGNFSRAVQLLGSPVAMAGHGITRVLTGNVGFPMQPGLCIADHGPVVNEWLGIDAWTRLPDPANSPAGKDAGLRKIWKENTGANRGAFSRESIELYHTEWRYRCKVCSSTDEPKIKAVVDVEFFLKTGEIVLWPQDNLSSLLQNNILGGLQALRDITAKAEPMTYDDDQTPDAKSGAGSSSQGVTYQSESSAWFSKPKPKQ